MGQPWGHHQLFEDGNGGFMLPASTKDRRSRRTARSPRWRDLWQIPCLCLGLIACLGATWHFHGSEWFGNREQHQAQQVLELLDQGRLADAQHLYRELLRLKQLDDSILQPFLEGSLILADALRQHPLPSRSKEAQEAYLKARELFQQILALKTKDVPQRLHYRLALAALGASELTPVALDTIEQSLDANVPDRSEGLELLAKLRQQLSPPDMNGALRALNMKLSQSQGTASPKLLLWKADLLSQLGHWAEIGKTVASIAPESPAYSQSLHWQALAAFEQQFWGESVRLWGMMPPREFNAQALLCYGEAQLQMKSPLEARQLWERLWREHLQSPEAVVAQSRLAALAQQQDRWHDAVQVMTALLSTRKATDYQSKYLSLKQLGSKVEELAKQLHQRHRWEDLRQLGEVALAWSFEGKAERWLSQAWHGIAVQSEASPVASKAFGQAAVFAWKAAQLANEGEKPALLLLAGEDALKGRNFQQAQKAFAELLSLKPDQKYLPRVLMGLADTLTEQKQYVFAADRLREALLIAGNHEAAARLKLAHVLLQIDKNSVEVGKQLEQAAALVIRPDSGDEAKSACHQWATYLVGEYFDRRSNQIIPARDACERALKLVPQHQLAAQTRYWLAELQLAEARQALETRKTDSFDEVQEKHLQLWQACQNFKQSAEELRAPAAIIMSKESKDTVIRNARFGQAESWFLLGSQRPVSVANIPSAEVCLQQSAEIYQSLVDASSNRVDKLYAYWKLSKCHEKRGMFAEMKETLSDASQQLQNMSDIELQIPSARFPNLSRSQWEACLRSTTLSDRGSP
jgi:tetratricopeptide (TPR) repeat protein